MTLAAIAAELGLDERTVRRVLEVALAKLRAGAEELEVEPEKFSSTVIATISGVPRRFSDIAAESDHVAPRAVAHQDSLSSMVGGKRVGLPRRFRSKP